MNASYLLRKYGFEKEANTLEAANAFCAEVVKDCVLTSTDYHEALVAYSDALDRLWNTQTILMAENMELQNTLDVIREMVEG